MFHIPWMLQQVNIMITMCYFCPEGYMLQTITVNVDSLGLQAMYLYSVGLCNSGP